MGDIAGVATISRAEHRARQGRPFLEQPALAEAIDAELVEAARPFLKSARCRFEADRGTIVSARQRAKP